MHNQIADEINISLLVSFLSFGIFSIVTFLLLFIYLKSKRKHEIELYKQKIATQEEINKTKNEIKNETLKQVANELHDNVGQIIALSRIHIKSLQKHYNDDKLIQLNELTENAMSEIRTLSKRLNEDIYTKLDLEQAITSLFDSINKTENIQAKKYIAGLDNFWNKDFEIVLFRIWQEFVSNSIKHSQCSKIQLSLTAKESELVLVIEDDGKGFDMDAIKKGSGIDNIMHRAKFIGADIIFDSAKELGTKLAISLKNSNHATL